MAPVPWAGLAALLAAHPQPYALFISLQPISCRPFLASLFFRHTRRVSRVPGLQISFCQRVSRCQGSTTTIARLRWEIGMGKLAGVWVQPEFEKVSISSHKRPALAAIVVLPFSLVSCQHLHASSETGFFSFSLFPFCRVPFPCHPCFELFLSFPTSPTHRHERSFAARSTAWRACSQSSCRPFGSSRLYLWKPPGEVPSHPSFRRPPGYRIA